ncbi:multidrug effflux MFS transporter [Acinetobacter wuhouensis]|uniref:Bcr/CflA family efflux transporter n=1 Tax=Acinetobacter wuhouensis TaxID=1879050 RepID=A0A4V2DN52_9GAMM|nr:multidrug effflux MFS transporter [Acinetobacter wuhouensis]RZG46652.1 Bcr/CflA family efflux MFS transporter [Acinetobacter wuhouensis]RZG72409.1 Bcr/CflA family efflux MFS transporter [Acinetobacter wuhouensis]
MSEKIAGQQYSTGWIMLLALFTSLGPLSIDMYLPALPEMAQDFNVSTQQIANTLPAYFFGLAVGQLIYGPISDRIGRKKPLYFGMALYAIASLLCVIAPDHWSLIAARVLQALGGCVGVVMARAAIRDCLDVQSSAQAFASMMIVMGIAPILAPTLGAAILHFFSWHAVFIALCIIGVMCFLCVHFLFKETLEPERRLDLSFNQVFILYASIFKDKSFRLPMMAGCFTGAALFCYISSASAVLMDGYHLTQQQFAIAFGFNAFGIILLSTLNKHLAHKLSVIRRLTIGGVIQLTGSVIIVIAGLMAQAPLVLVMFGLFLTVSGIGFTGPNAMAFAMSEQGARAGTASAIMGSMQFACGLLGGVVLNFLVWNHVLNMGILMLLFTMAGFVAILAVGKDLKAKAI